MAMQSPFFGKRDSESAAQRHVIPAPVLQGRPAAASATAQAPAPAPLAVVVDAPAAAVQPGGAAGGSKLTVGPNIKLKGVEITDCDTLMVEGTVEATMDSRLMQIADGGAFRGSADIDIAEIRGHFDGSLNVRQRLVVHATGRVHGKIRYGRLVVEEGGQLSGDVVQGDAADPAPLAAVAKASLQAA